MDAGTIKGRIELDHGGVLTSMAATVTAVRGGTATLRGLLASPLKLAIDGSGLRGQLATMTGQAAGFIKSIAEAAKSSTQLAKALGDTERAVRSLNDQAGETDTTIRRLGTTSTDAATQVTPLAEATRQARTAVTGLRSAADAGTTALARAADGSRDLGVATTGLSGRLGTLARQTDAVATGAATSATAIVGASAATGGYVAPATAAAAAGRELATALQAVATASGRAARGQSDAAASTAAYATAAAAAVVAGTALARTNYAAAASATGLSRASREAMRDIVLMRVAANNGEGADLFRGLEGAVQRLLPLMDGATPRIQTIWQMVRGAGGAAAEATPAIEGLAGGMLALPGPTAAAAGGVGAVTVGLGALLATAVVVVPPLIGLGVTLAALHSGPVKLAAEMEQTSIAFGVLTGSAANAKAMLKDLQAFADTTPFEFPEIAAAAKQLLAMGIASGQITGTLRMLGDVSSGLGQPLGEMAYLFGQIRSQGRAMTQDLNQFAGRGVPIYTELAKVLHTNEVGVRAFAEQGRIGFAQIEAAFKAMTSEGGKFGGLTQLQGQSLMGLQSTAADTYRGIERQVGQVLIKNLDLKGTIQSVTDLLGAIGPVAVRAFDTGSIALSPFIGSFRSVIELGTQISRLLAETGRSMDAAFGDGASANVVKFAAAFNPLALTIKAISLLIDGVSFAIKTIADGIKVINDWLGSGAADAKNHTAITKEEIADGIKRKAEKEKAAGTADATGGGTAGTAGAIASNPVGSAGGAGSGGGGDTAKADAEKSAEKVRELQTAATVAQLRAAHREYEAQMTQMNADYERDLAKAKSSDELAMVRKKYEADWEEAAAKQREERAKVAAESRVRGEHAMIQAQIATLKAAGKDLDAKVAEIKARFGPEIGAAKSDRERAALQIQQDAEINEAKAADAEKTADRQKQAQDKLARDKEQQDRQAAERAGRIADFEADTRAAALEASGDKAAADLLRFDGEWAKRLASIKDDGERAAATANYNAQRALKVQQAGERAGSDAALRFGSPLASLPTSTKEAQDRVRGAKAGSGERELARLDLRDSLGKPLTREESARRTRLGERFGRGGDPLAALAPALIPGRSTPGGRGGAGGGATIAPVIGFDTVAAAKALVEAVRPVIREEIGHLAAGLRDRNHAANTGANL